jgi:hypothetical protein
MASHMTLQGQKRFDYTVFMSRFNCQTCLHCMQSKSAQKIVWHIVFSQFRKQCTHWTDRKWLKIFLLMIVWFSKFERLTLLQQMCLKKSMCLSVFVLHSKPLICLKISPEDLISDGFQDLGMWQELDFKAFSVFLKKRTKNQTISKILEKNSLSQYPSQELLRHWFCFLQYRLCHELTEVSRPNRFKWLASLSGKALRPGLQRSGRTVLYNSQCHWQLN